MRFRFEGWWEVDGRVGEAEVEMRRLLDCACEEESLRGMVVLGIEMVRAWIGRKGFRSFKGEKEGLVGGAMDVGVGEARGEGGADEKWSDGEAGENSSASWGGDRIPSEEKEEWILSCGGSRRSS